MTPAEFTKSLERHLRTHGIPFARGDLIAFVESAWSLIEDNPDLAYWCQAFRERLAACRAPGEEVTHP
jgi:hypothetical protein